MERILHVSASLEQHTHIHNLFLWKYVTAPSELDDSVGTMPRSVIIYQRYVKLKNDFQNSTSSSVKSRS